MQIGDRVLLRPKKELIEEYRLRDLDEADLLRYSKPMRNKVLEIVDMFPEDESVYDQYTIVKAKHQETNRLLYVFELIVLP